MVDQIIEQPVIDFDELSWGDTKAIIVAATAIDQAQKAGDSSALARAMAAMEQVIGPIIVSLPPSWIVKRAPKDIDYCNGGLNYLKKDRFFELVNLVAVGTQTAEDNAKN